MPSPAAQSASHHAKQPAGKRRRPNRTEAEIRNSMAAAHKSTSQLWLNGKYSDLKISCRGSIFKAHRVILASRCSFFEICCGRGFEESHTQTIDMDDDDPEALEAFLKYLYTFDTSHIDQRGITHRRVEPGYFTFLVQTFTLANKYDQPLLEEHIAKLLGWQAWCSLCSARKAQGESIQCVCFYRTKKTNFQGEILKALPLAASLDGAGDFGHDVFERLLHMAAETFARLDDSVSEASSPETQEIVDVLNEQPHVSMLLLRRLGSRLRLAREQADAFKDAYRELKNRRNSGRG